MSKIILKKPLDTQMCPPGHHIVDKSREDLEDPVINIAVGIRWLIVKFWLLKKKDRDNLKMLLQYYYGHKDEKENEKYTNKVFEYYNTAVKPKHISK